MNITSVKTLIFLLSLSTASSAFAQEAHAVPNSLFGIALGGIYDIGEEGRDLGDIPVKRFAGAQRFMGAGIHYYFQPKKEYKLFPYSEKRKKPKDKLFETSFRLYLLPVVPSTVTDLNQLNNANSKWEVTAIEWAEPTPNKSDDAYYWAKNLCKTFSADLAVKPEIDDLYLSKLYKCVFADGDREFTVSNYYSQKSVTLDFNKNVFNQKNEAVETKFRKLQAQEIRPY